ncbi:neurofibromin-like [Fundulus heteroclitus]|uniref:neurofibromin-like n=1 Tax=Fundulus heteroclitus TaxID=8078 RepID=UPI00165C4F8A|nr:neurofibromin-like [Fundulus heteroclitus]
MCQDINLLNPVHGIVQSVVYHEESPPQYQPSYLQSFGFNGLWRFAGPFSKQTQIPDYAELIVKFLEALIDSYLPTADEEKGEEQLRTPTSPYPPSSQSQLSITANLNLSNSMTSLATSQHSPDSGALICKGNSKLTFIREHNFGPLGSSPVLFVFSPCEMLLMMSLGQEWIDKRSATAETHVLCTYVPGGPWISDSI